MTPSQRIAAAVLKQRGRFTARQISQESGVDATHVAAEFTRWVRLGRILRHEPSPGWPRITFEVRDPALVEAVANGLKPLSGQAWRTARVDGHSAEEATAATPAAVAAAVIEDCHFFVAHTGELQFIRSGDGELVRAFSPAAALQLCTFLANVRDHIEAQVEASAA